MKVHFIGIGGVSMSALARILHSRGHVVSGSDVNADSLSGLDFALTFPLHSAKNIHDTLPDLVVYTAAVKQDNPELETARRLNIKVLERSALLGMLSGEYPCSIAVSGTHGKTTTTAMIASILLPKNPTVHLGGDYSGIAGNVRIGGGEIFLTEACEYVRSFLTLTPSIGVILNVSPDHLDYYKDITDIEEAFCQFAEGVRGGAVVAWEGCGALGSIIRRAGADVVTFGMRGDYAADDLSLTADGCSFNLLERGTRVQRVALRVRGEHNVLNALAATAAARCAGASLGEVTDGLYAFSGVDRRFEDVGYIGGIRVILDYAHHPEELSASIKTARLLADRVIVAFQPHTYTRTKAFLMEFAEVLKQADEVFLAPVYAARETPMDGGTSSNLKAALSSLGKSSTLATLSNLSTLLPKACTTQNTVLLLLGAGNINSLTHSLPLSRVEMR